MTKAKKSSILEEMAKLNNSDAGWYEKILTASGALDGEEVNGYCSAFEEAQSRASKMIIADDFHRFVFG